MRKLNYAKELYRPSDRRLSAKLLSIFADGGCRVVRATDPHACILGFIDRSCYYFFQVAPQLYSQSWVDSVPDPLLRTFDSAGNRSRNLWTCSQEFWPLTTVAISEKSNKDGQSLGQKENGGNCFFVCQITVFGICTFLRILSPKPYAPVWGLWFLVQWILTCKN
jgi:hypothetical protein